MDNDADYYQFWFYLPVNYPEVKADLFGYFLFDNENYTTSLLPEAGSVMFTRGSVVTGVFYHLQPEHQYTATLYGMYNTGNGDQIFSSDANPETFTTRAYLLLFSKYYRHSCLFANCFCDSQLSHT